jgi:hypothetical protein
MGINCSLFSDASRTAWCICKDLDFVREVFSLDFWPANDYPELRRGFSQSMQETFAILSQLGYELVKTFNLFIYEMSSHSTLFNRCYAFNE